MVKGTPGGSLILNLLHVSLLKYSNQSAPNRLWICMALFCDRFMGAIWNATCLCRCSTVPRCKWSACAPAGLGHYGGWKRRAWWNRLYAAAILWRKRKSGNREKWDMARKKRGSLCSLSPSFLLKMLLQQKAWMARLISMASDKMYNSGSIPHMLYGILLHKAPV